MNTELNQISVSFSTKKFLKYLLILILSLVVGCNSSTIEDAIDVIDEPDRKTIDVSKLGLNAFVNDSRFGTANQQLLEVRDTLKINHVRLLFNWDDGSHPSASIAPNFSFVDNIVSSIPDGMSAIVVLTGVPSWMRNSQNWTNGNPRTTFVERWVKPIARRFKDSSRIAGWEIWNEPNMVTSDNSLMGFVESPENYVEMLAMAFNVVKDVDPDALVITAATTAINQNYPESLDYNRKMRDAGAIEFTDKWNVHYYGKQFENVVRPNGVSSFLNGLSKGILVTESGAQGIAEQLAYGEKVWPYLLEKIPGIERIYIYQFTEDSSPANTYGLKNPSRENPVSDLYEHLKERGA